MSAGATGSGAKLFLGPINTTADTQSVYSGLTYAEVGQIESIGEFGDTAQTVTFNTLANGRTNKAKGSKDAGDITLTVIHDPLDVGQLALLAAAATPNMYAVKVSIVDAADANDTNSVFYFRCRVMSKKINVGDNNTVIKRTFVLGITSAPVEFLSVAVP